MNLEKLLEKYIQEQVAKRVDEILAERFAFLNSTFAKEEVSPLVLQKKRGRPKKAEAPRQATETAYKPNPLRACTKCGVSKPVRWMEGDACKKCLGIATTTKAPAVAKATGAQIRICKSCNTRRRSLDSSGVCRFCYRNGPVAVSKIEEPPAVAYPPYYEEMLNLFHVSKFCVNDICEYTTSGFSIDGALRVLRSWNQKGLAVEVNKDSNPGAHTWKLTPSGASPKGMVHESCGRKRGYVEEGRADEALIFYRENGSLTKEHKVYRCAYGNHFHIGRPSEAGVA